MARLPPCFTRLKPADKDPEDKMNFTSTPQHRKLTIDGAVKALRELAEIEAAIRWGRDPREFVDYYIDPEATLELAAEVAALAEEGPRGPRAA